MAEDVSQSEHEPGLALEEGVEVSDEELLLERANTHHRPVDRQGTSRLPFGELSSRRFEILVYCLCVASERDQRFVLMKGVHDQARDLIAYDDSGSLSKILQCKNYARALDKPTLGRFLAELAMYRLEDAEFRARTDKVEVEVWCSGRFAETAHEFANTFATFDDSEAAKEWISNRKKAIKALKDIDVDQAVSFFVSTFRDRISLSLVTGIDITAKLREHPDVEEEFFQIRTVVREDRVAGLLRNELERSGLTALVDPDARDLLNRLASSSDDRRLDTGLFRLFGVSHGHFSLLGTTIKPTLFQLAGGYAQLTQALQEATSEQAERLLEERLKPLTDLKPVTRHYVRYFFKTKIQAAYKKETMPESLERPGPSAEIPPLGAAEFKWKRFILSQLGSEYDIWKAGAIDQLQGDEELRRLKVGILNHLYKEFTSFDEVTSAIFSDLAEHPRLLHDLNEAVQPFLPKDTTLVIESLTFFDDKERTRRVFESVAKLAGVEGANMRPPEDGQAQAEEEVERRCPNCGAEAEPFQVKGPDGKETTRCQECRES